MSIGIGQNISESLGFTTNSTVKHIGRWFGMGILLCIPIVNFIVLGMFLKALRNEEVNFSDVGKSFVQGLLATIITIIYLLIPTIIFMILGGAGFMTGVLAGDFNVALGGALIGIVISSIIAIIFSLVSTPALVRYARTGQFGSAFQFSEIFAMIKKLGWGKYILAIIVLCIVAFIMALIVGLIFGVIAIIPIVGLLIAAILSFLIDPFFLIFCVRYCGNLFE